MALELGTLLGYLIDSRGALLPDLCAPLQELPGTASPELDDAASTAAAAAAAADAAAVEAGEAAPDATVGEEGVAGEGEARGELAGGCAAAR